MTQPKTKNALLGAILTVGGSIGLLAVSVVTVMYSNVVSSAGGDSQGYYTGYDDKTEVVNKLEFVNSGNQTDAGVISEMYAQDGTILVLSGGSLVTSSDGINLGASDSQVIGGSNISVGSDNITIIGGSDITISEGNDNATVLGGSGNILSGASGNTPSVLVGGAGNEISGSEGGVIVGGSGNKISGGSNSQILGGEGNELVDAENAFVAGSGVKNEGVGASFVFSDGSESFSPVTSGAFYINTVNGLGLNAPSTSGALTSSGGISVGSIDITDSRYACNDSNIGIQGVYNTTYDEKSIGCLLGCTTGSAQNGGKWDLLEASALCMDWCDDSDNCVNTVRTEYNPYIAWCNTDSLTFSIEGLRHCPMAVDETLFRDVVFDVDFVTECPSGDTLSMLANPCVYQCPEGYVSNDDGDGCVSSCTLPWDPSVKVPYGTVKTGYNISGTGVACGAEKNPDGSSKTCKDKLVRIKCDNNNGAGYWRSLDGVVNVSNLKGSCELDKGAVCSGYNLTSTGEDGRNYTGCTEYTTVGNTECNPVTKYKYDGCLSGYTEVGGVCVKGCTLPWDSTRMIAAGQSVTGYSHNVVSCNDGGVLTSCDDWKRVMTCLGNETWSDGDDPNTYKYETCVVEKVDIDPMYNLEKCPVARMASGTFVEGMGMEDGKTQIGICASQTGYTVSGGKVCEIYHRYKLTGCISGYTMSGDWCLPSCITPWSTNSGLQYGVPNAGWNNTGMAVKRGDSIKGYATTSQQCPVPTTSGTNYLSGCEASTNWTMMTCGSGGVLGGRDTYKYNSCNSLPLVYPEEYNRDERVANAECVWFQPYSTGNNVCNEDHLRWKCTRCDTGYTLNGKSLTGGDVDAKCLKDCDFNAYLYGATTPTKYTLNGYTGQILVYNANMYTCNTSYKSGEDTWKCYSGTITNTNGNVPVGSVPYLTGGNGLRQTALRPTPLVVNDGTQTGTRTIIKNGSNTTHGIANAVTVSVSGRVNPFVYYSTGANPACTPDNTYHYLKCNVNSGYVWSTTSDKCIRCEGSIPAGGTGNNNKYPSTDSITYCYSEDASLACSFKALDGYHWVPSTTGAYTKCGTSERGDIQSWYCDLDGGSTKILHGTTYPIYKPSNSTICNTECQKITAICKNGKWMSGSTEITGISYSSCSTRNGYVITYPTKKSPAAGSYNPTTGTYEKKLTSQPANTVVKEKATEYSANGLSCITGNSYFKVECPSANYYWTGNLCQPYCTGLDGSKYRQGQTVSTYDSPNPSCPTACATVTATCKADGTWNRALNGTCATQTGSKCNSSFDLTTNSDSHGLYDTCSAANGQGCYNRYHMTGCVAGYTLVAADHKCYANCTLDGKTINHGATGEWYSKSESCASAGTACSSLKQVLRCDNGTLYKNGTSTKVTAGYYSGCVNKCYDCTGTPWGTVPHLSSRTGYFSSPVSCTSASTKCTYEVRTCMNGTLQGSSSANLTGCTLTSTDNCPAESSTNKKAVSFSDVNATISSTCNTNAFSANNNTSDNTKSTCDTVVYNYYVCKSGYHFNSGKTACVQNPSCGTANGTTISSAPSTAAQRCFVGSIDGSVSTNASTYTWSCKNGVQTVSCSAYRSPTCGSANGSSYSSAPTSNLCGIGTKTSGVTTNTATYSWVCSNGSSTKDCTACKNASCGTPSGGTFLDAPSSNLCTIGSASAVTRSAAGTTATYSWSCTNSCGDSTNCSKNYTCTNTCPSGTSLSCSCGGTISSTNSCGNSCYTCNASPTCGSANGGSYTSAPTSNLCGVGIASSVTPSGSTYKWTCGNGSCNENCSASMISNCATADGYSVNNGTTASYYTAGTVSCTSASAKCSSQSLLCSNGSFYKNGKVSSAKLVSSSNVYKNCSTSSPSCSYTSSHPLSSAPQHASYVGPVYCYAKNTSTDCKVSYTGYKLTSCDAGYYLNAAGTGCTNICNVTSSSSPCNGGYSKSGTKRAFSYSCTSGSASSPSNSSATCSCPIGRVWNGNYCAPIVSPVCNTSASSPSSDGCNQGQFSGTNSARDCLAADGSKLNSSTCTKSSPITINISCYVQRETVSQSSYYRCDGPARGNTTYSADRALPTGLVITETLKYKGLTDAPNCTYGFTENTDFDYQIDSGSTVAELVFNSKFQTTSWTHDEGYRSYYEYVGASLSTTSVTINGQQYNFNLKSCTYGTESKDPDPVCGSAHGTTRTSQPSTSELCAYGTSYGGISTTSNGWSRTCTSNGSYAYCSATKQSSCTPKTCSSYGLTASPTGTCWKGVTTGNGCGGNIYCYINGCDAMGFNGYTCTNSASTASNACAPYPIIESAGDGYCYTCGTVCPATGVCGVTPAGETCTTYSMAVAPNCNNYKNVITCRSDGTWSGTPSYYGGCRAPYNCSAKNGCPATNNGYSCTTYAKDTATNCDNFKVVSTCNDGSWSTTPAAYSSCQTATPANCYFNGNVVNHGSSVTAYLYSSRPYGSSCTSETRTCNNGTLNGSYQYSSCSYYCESPNFKTKAECEAALPNSGYGKCEPGIDSNCPWSFALNAGCSATNGCPGGVAGDTCTTYQTSSCASLSRISTCTDGSWTPTPYNYSTCTNTSCPASGACPLTSNGGSCTSYSISMGTTTECNNAKITSTCNNGTRSNTPGDFSSCTKALSCFIAGTQVTMADGSTKNIEDVQIGDMLLGETSINTVEEFYRPLLGNQGLYSINGSKNFVSPAHPFMTTEGWKSLDPQESSNMLGIEVGLLEVGDVLIREDGEEKIETLVGISADEDTQLYNFRVSGDNTYYANGYLVHNKPALLEDLCIDSCFNGMSACEAASMNAGYGGYCVNNCTTAEINAGQECCFCYY